MLRCPVLNTVVGKQTIPAKEMVIPPTIHPEQDMKSSHMYNYE